MDHEHEHGHRHRRQRIVEDIENAVDEVNKVVRIGVARGSEVAETVGESLRESISDTLHGVRSTRDNVVMVRTNKSSLDRMDELFEGGIANSRSEAAAFLIAEGIKARQGLFDRISEKIEEIRKAKEELRLLVDEEDRDGDKSPTTENAEEPKP